MSDQNKYYSDLIKKIESRYAGYCKCFCNKKQKEILKLIDEFCELLRKERKIKSLGNYVESHTGIPKDTFYKWRSSTSYIPSEINVMRFLALVSHLDPHKANELGNLYNPKSMEKRFIYDEIIPDKNLDDFEKVIIISHFFKK